MISQFDTPLARFTRIPVEEVDEGDLLDGSERELLAPNEYEDVLAPDRDEEGKTKLPACVLDLL